MVTIRTSDGYFGFGKQASKGTAVTPTKFARLSGPESFMHTQELYEERSLNADRELDHVYKTLHVADGGYPLLARPDIGAFLLAMLLGADAVVTGTVHTHTITRADTIPWLTIERKLSSNERIKDAKMNQLVIAGQAGQPITIDGNFMGNDVNIESASTPSYETNKAFRFWEGAYTLDGSGTDLLTSFRLTITNGLEGIQTTGFKRNDLGEGPFDISLEFSVKMEDDTQYLAVLLAGATALANTLDDGSFIIDLTRGSGATERQLKIELPDLKHISAEKHLDPVSKASILTVTSRALWDTSNEIITVTGKNTVSSAYI